MFTKNFDVIMAIGFGFLKNGDSSNIGFTLVAPSGATKQARCGNNSYRYYAMPAGISTVKTSIPSDTASSGILFGNGTTPPSRDDHTISGDAFTNVSVTKTEDTASVSGSTVTVKKTFYLNNTGTTDFTISEVAMFCDNSAVGCCALMDRTLLDEPVTVPAGGVGKVEYSVSLTIPST